MRHAVKARRLGSIALRETGGLILACEDGLYAFNPRTGEQRFLVDPEPDAENHRKNDGRADPGGNFWIGTLEEQTFGPVGKLYRVDSALNVTEQTNGLRVPNSLAFDPERGRMYLSDTRAFTIWVFDYDVASGDISNRRFFAKTAAPARPDGSCIDAEGFLWNAQYAGARIVRYAPTGEIDRTLDLPVSHPTCCCFGGRDLDRLFVTSASEPLSPSQRSTEPVAGRLMALDPGVRGRPENRVKF